MKLSKAELKEKLRQRLYEKKMSRTSRVSREERLDELQKQLKKCKTDKEKSRIQHQIDLLEEIETKEYEKFSNTEIPEYDN